MRIITGSHKGRRLKVKPGGKIRPTSNRVRAAIFNILPLDLDGACVLDLYAGTGALGLEALSRGAFSAVFVDSGREAARILLENLRAMNLMESSRIMNKKVLPALKLLAAEGRRFDLVFADPPYRSQEAEKVMRELATMGLLSESALVVVEHDAAEKLADGYGPLRQSDRREYGGTAVTFFQQGGTPP